MILSPHLDDAVLSCWRVLEAHRSVRVVNVFTGSPPEGSPAPWWDRLTGATDPVRRMAERRAEDRRALALANERRAIGVHGPPGLGRAIASSSRPGRVAAA